MEPKHHHNKQRKKDKKNASFVVIDVVPDKVIWTVNCLHYLNYEPIARTSSTCYLVCNRTDLG